MLSPYNRRARLTSSALLFPGRTVIPKNSVDLGSYLVCLSSARRYRDAIVTAYRALTIDDSARAPWEWRSKSLFQLGRGPDAVRALAQEAFAEHFATLDAAVRDGGASAGLRTLLSVTGDWRLRAEQSWRRIAWRALLQDDAGALDELEQAFQLRNVNLMYAAVDPAYDRIRPHSRFQRVLTRMGLAPGVP